MIGARRRRETVADEALVRSLYEEHGRAMMTYATRLLSGDRAAAEDVVQEALVRAWRHPDSLVNGKGSVRGWLLTVVRNIVFDQMRARKVRPSDAAGLDIDGAVAGDHSQQVVDTVAVTAALERLSDDHRAVLTELYLRQQTIPEAAVSLGIPQGTVKSRSYVALRALRALFPGHRADLKEVAG